MKKILLIFIAVMVIAIFAVSCSKDKDEILTNDEIVGKWALVYLFNYEEVITVVNGNAIGSEIINEIDHLCEQWDARYYEIRFKGDRTLEEQHNEKGGWATGAWLRDGNLLQIYYYGVGSTAATSKEILNYEITEFKTDEFTIVFEKQYITFPWMPTDSEIGKIHNIYNKQVFRRISN
ncbi:MAG: hypothetical protein LUF90_11290 [Rikenellaceae bacterium]|nr:hypothetical protein [Rikenellaceae bacterium]